MYNSKLIFDNPLQSLRRRRPYARLAGLLLALPTTPTARAAGDATGKPIITGTAWVDETESAETSGTGDADGLDNATFT